MWKPLVTAFTLILAGCSEYGAYVYQPAEHATRATSGYPAANYGVPPESPRGEVNIASFGITDMQLGEDGSRTRFLQVRMIISNNNDVGPWSADTRQQLIEIAGEGQSRPAYVNTDRGTLPIITIAAGEKRTLDLYYPLPVGMQKVARIPQFDLLWHVQTPSRLVAERTPFERVAVDEEVASAYGYAYPEWTFSAGWGPVWWYDPLFPVVTFRHPVIIHQRYPVFARSPYLAPYRVFSRPPGLHAVRPGAPRIIHAAPAGRPVHVSPPPAHRG